MYLSWVRRVGRVEYSFVSRLISKAHIEVERLRPLGQLRWLYNKVIFVKKIVKYFKFQIGY